ncbi:NAD(P)/FAD-dependent oxidoreductase [Acidimangrovimonas sediminis]|uniref:NAD(P)/FAD-dependent oxidoreductase n=1 Tax=Acidimangrovimonas sediminis TaxID=2056283 RepID=UPI000C7F8D12|nr:FAD-dependent oxidoreductase [Acidimangrovimonas sediminis]
MTLDPTEPPYILSAPPAPPTVPLDGARRVDVAIVGAGFTGLIAALSLAERGLRVAVVEAAEIGSGGSGRNHGQCIPVFGYLDPRILPPEGFDLLLNAGRRVFDMIARHGIACEPVQKGTLAAAHNAAGLERMRAQHKLYAGWGKSGAFLGRDAVAEATGNDRFLGGWVHSDGGHVNPLAYVRGLAAAARAAGVEIFTASPVTGISRRDGQWRLSTPAGEIAAPVAGFATNAYSGHGAPQGVVRSFVPLSSYAVASAPLTPEQRAQVMPSGMNFGDTHNDPMFFRVDAAGRIITGGLVEARRGRDFAYTGAFMTRRLAGLYPVLEGLRWEHMWRGTIAAAPTKRPGILSLDDGLWALTGYTGRGVPTSAALGEAFARTLAAPEEGARSWPQSRPRRIYARHLIGLTVQTFRGPLNKLKDRRARQHPD